MAKIVLLSNAYKPQYGGLVSYLENFSKNIIKHFPEYKVEIVVLNNNNSLESKEVINGVLVHRVLVPKVNFKNLFVYHSLLIKIGRNYIKENFSNEDYYIVRHLHFAKVLSTIYSDRTLFLIPVLIKRMLDFNYKRNDLVNNCFNFISLKQLSKMENEVMLDISAVGVLSESKKLEVLSVYNKSADIILPAVDMDKFKPGSSKEKQVILQKLKRSEDFNKKIILTVSRLTKEKNTSMLIEAMEFIDSEYLLYVVGDGELETELKSLAKQKKLSNRVIFFGKRDDVEQFYKVADLFALLSTYEGLGHVYLEALASGVPIIALKNNPPKVINASEELIKENINGFTVISIDDLVNKINKLHPDYIEVMKKNSVDYALEKYNWSVHIKKCMSLIDDKSREIYDQ